MDDELNFADETMDAEALASPSPWRVLVVDDDPDVFRVTQLNLKRLRFRGRTVELLVASSGKDARELLRNEHDIALALIDVVMENEVAGLDLVRSVRTDLGLRETRIILRTGQPGQAPEQDVIFDYEVDGYVAKAEMTAAKLTTAVVAALRAYETLCEFANLSRELEMRVAARTCELEKLSMIDPLTGVANRRHFEARADIEVAAARRDGLPLAIVVMDIDHFKRVNDDYGHAVGDAVLQRFARVVECHVRPSDLIARIGGEEFALLLPRSDHEASVAVAERVRTAVEQEPFDTVAASLRVTASFGAALLAPGDENITAPLARADAALYRAKAAGRNVVLS
ncbi:two-component system, cell cycle response regulator [Pararobbsia alpina]|uniref:GGDEF domain-containing protein n=1 Tax=Pararobbsia alpina TaxID=621374 RepID=UPI0039A4BE8E